MMSSRLHVFAEQAQTLLRLHDVACLDMPLNCRFTSVSSPNTWMTGDRLSYRLGCLQIGVRQSGLWSPFGTEKTQVVG